MTANLKNLWPTLLITLGAALAIGSIVCGVLVIGIPGPDDTPAEAARQRAQGDFTMAAFLFGSLLFVTGAVAAVARLLTGSPRERRS